MKYYSHLRFFVYIYIYICIRSDKSTQDKSTLTTFVQYSTGISICICMSVYNTTEYNRKTNKYATS